MRKLPVIMALALASTASPCVALEFVPLYKLSVLGGQYFMHGDKSNLRANVKAYAAPVVKLDEGWSLLPLYNARYRGTKSITDGVGAGTLYQQGMDHRAAFGVVYSPEDTTWKFKPSLSYKWEFLKETRDEAWGRGLFDYENSAFSFSAENEYRKPFSYRLGYEFYYIRFPNYQSLESQAGTDPSGNPLNRENAGTDVLDTINNAASFSVSVPVPYDDPKLALQLGYRFLWQRFPDQPIIMQTGEVNDHKPYNRQDFQNSVSASLTYPRDIGKVRSSFGFGAGSVYNGSNQNTYDVSKLRFVSDSYSYYSITAGPNASLSWGDEKQPSTVGASFSYSRTQYLGRLAQDADGNYLSAKQYQDRYIASLSYGYPVAPGFQLKAQTNFLWQTSNQAYEKTYPYDYKNATYLIGFTYEY